MVVLSPKSWVKYEEALENIWGEMQQCGGEDRGSSFVVGGHHAEGCEGASGWGQDVGGQVLFFLIQGSG